MYDGKRPDLAAFSSQLKSLGAYLRAEIWVADNQGAILWTAGTAAGHRL